MALEPHSTFGFSLLLSGSDCPLCSVLFLVDSLTSLSCIYAAFCSGGRRHLLAPPGKDEKNFFYQKTMIVITIAFVSCISWLRSGIERYADRKLSPCCQFFVSGFVGLLTDPFMRRGFSPLRKRIASAFSPGHDSPSNDRFSPHAGISRMENNTLELQLLSESCRALAISNVQTAILRWIPSVSGILTRFPFHRLYPYNTADTLCDYSFFSIISSKICTVNVLYY